MGRSTGVHSRCRPEFLFLSPKDVLHARHLANTSAVAVAVFDHEQPEYSPGMSVTINGVQIEAAAYRLVEAEYPDFIISAIDELKPPMPPYAVFKIEPLRWYVPKIEKGVNIRMEVQVSSGHGDATA